MKSLTKKRLPFLVLLGIHLVALGFVFYKYEDKKRMFALLMSQIGIAYIFEYFVLVLARAYVYKPRLSRKSYIDNVIGSVFSQSIFVPIASLLLVKLKSGWRGKITLAALFTVIEQFFIKQKVYQTNWWTPLFTFILLPLYFRWGQYWNTLLSQKNAFAQFLSLYFCIWVSGMNTLYSVAVSRSYKFGIGKKHTWREHFIVAPLFSTLLSFLATLQVKLFPEIGPMIMYVEAVLVDFFFLKMGLINSKYSYPPENVVGHLVMAAITKIYRNWIYGHDAGSINSKSR